MRCPVLVGFFKTGLVMFGNAVRSALPRAALLGSIGGAGIALIGLLPLLKVFADPIVGFVGLGVILITLFGLRRLRSHRPFRGAQPGGRPRDPLTRPAGTPATARISSGLHDTVHGNATRSL